MCESNTLTRRKMRAELRQLNGSMTRKRSLSGVILPLALLMVGAYFTFAAVQGDYGLFSRIQVDAEADELRLELAQLQAQTERMEILTRRLSDDFLDLDLLDEQARDILGYVRADEIVIP